MAKKDKAQAEQETAVAESPLAETEVTEESADKPKKSSKPDITGLVKMTRDGKHIHAHPTVVEEHKKNGWKLA